MPQPGSSFSKNEAFPNRPQIPLVIDLDYGLDSLLSTANRLPLQVRALQLSTRLTATSVSEEMVQLLNACGNP